MCVHKRGWIGVFISEGVCSVLSFKQLVKLFFQCGPPDNASP